jgi:putative DNA primase/helicase
LSTIPKTVENLADHQNKGTMSYLPTDGSNAERFVAEHGHEVRYCHTWNKWMVWDGRRWVVDDCGQVHQLAKATVRRMQREATDEPDDDKRKAKLGWARQSDSRWRREAMLALATSEPGIPVTTRDLDRDQWLLNCTNGTVNLRTGMMQSHQREDLITKMCPVAFDPAAKAPRWHRFLEEIQPDPDTRRFLQAATGYSLTGDVSEECLFFLLGPGQNGKSKFLGALQETFGDYSAQIAPDVLMVRNRENRDTDRAELFGLRFVSTIEVNQGQRFDESNLKWLTGGDKIRARRLYENSWQFDPTHKLWLAANYTPVIRGNDLGVWRRIRLIPFSVTIPETKRDLRLAETLKAEGSGILRWAVEGCLAWQQDGRLLDVAAVKSATADYRDSMDLVGRFVADRCRVDAFSEVMATGLYRHFVEWCQESREYVFPQKEFTRRLTDHDFVNVHRRNGSWWLGLGLVTGDSQAGDVTGVTGVTANYRKSPNGSEGEKFPECDVTAVTETRNREPGDDDEPLPEGVT